MWETITIEGAEGADEELSRVDLGLDATAESMHGRFLADLPHLDAVKETHERIIAEASGIIPSAKESARGFDSPNVSFDILDESAIQSGFELELNSESLANVSVATILNEKNRMVRIIAPERFGGIVHTLTLPSAMSVESASLNDGILSLKFN